MLQPSQTQGWLGYAESSHSSHHLLFLLSPNVPDEILLSLPSAFQPNSLSPAPYLQEQVIAPLSRKTSTFQTHGTLPNRPSPQGPLEYPPTPHHPHGGQDYK